ncbi:MAG: hypothetical protein ABSD57_09170 [Verrucomicrobiota bacterium]|jgi:hypothetical protein
MEDSNAARSGRMKTQRQLCFDKSFNRAQSQDREMGHIGIFRGAGWRRVSLLGETMKYVDLELEEPITGDLYQVQVKSRASLAEFKEYAENFSGAGFRKLYFVVHTPTGNWNDQKTLENVELWLPKQVARMVVEFGLTNWLLKKVR